MSTIGGLVFCSKIESLVGGDWNGLLPREVNYVGVVFYFTSRQTSCNLGRQHLSPVRHIVVFPNYSMLGSKLQKQAFCNLGRQALSHGRQHLDSPNYRMLVSVISSQAFCNLGRQQHVPREINVVSPNYRMFAWMWNKKLHQHNLLLSATD